MSAKKERTNPILAKHPMRNASPAVGQPVSGTVQVQVTASDDSGITEVLSRMPRFPPRHGEATGTIPVREGLSALHPQDDPLREGLTNAGGGERATTLDFPYLGCFAQEG